MRKLFLISIFVSFNLLLVHAQPNENLQCPEVTLAVPKDAGYMGRGEQYYLTVSVLDDNWEKLKYEWTLSENLPFELQGKPVIYFLAKEEFEGLEIKATVKIEGLPKKCENTFSEVFKIQFNPGSPIVLEDYGKLNFSEEKTRLDNVIYRMKEYDTKDSIALFLIRYDKKDTKQTLKNRVLRISNYLTEKHKFPVDKINFVFTGDDGINTRVYIAPLSVGKQFNNWEENLEKLFTKSSVKYQ